MTLAQRETEKAVKRAIRDKGVRKISQVKRSEIAALGREYLIAHPELIVQAKPVIERCERGLLWKASCPDWSHSVSNCEHFADQR
jgi:hypothetical protein